MLGPSGGRPRHGWMEGAWPGLQGGCVVGGLQGGAGCEMRMMVRGCAAEAKIMGGGWCAHGHGDLAVVACGGEK